MQPQCLFVNVGGEKTAEQALKDLLKDEIIEDDLIWKVVNKYYSCSVKIEASNSVPESVGEGIEAILLYIEGVADIAGQLKPLEDVPSDPDVKLCVVKSVAKEIVDSLTDWSLEHGWELIDLDEDYSQDDDSTIFAATGQKRVVEALQTCPWTNMKMVGDDEEKPEADDDRLNDTDVEEDFEGLFEKFADFKETASRLPESERKAYAEKVVLQFWKAMGGDEDEIAGLDDSD